MSGVEIGPNSTMQEVLDAYPTAQRALMRGYHIGGCNSCGFDPTERLSDVLARKDVSNVDEVIQFIKKSHEDEQRIQISPTELSEALKADERLRLIDVREPHEQDIAKIEGSLSATQELIDEMISDWSKDTLVVTYCHHGMRSMDAAAYLIGHGFTNVRSMTGGIDAWAEQIEPSMARY